ncbi:hypothetical protein NGRA_0244 [Nosema granulosis]|uniref:Uncharacterized protein n=1 Tax=Nosema granulosis TaxID=83296 RepID=A0A9P6L083_9MICR|nr:hypothetical protein NGRA_0244 [Nosema granulosis]
MLEVIENGDGFLYGDSDVYGQYINFITLSTENVNGVLVKSISNISHKSTPLLNSHPHKNYKFKCQHGIDIEYASINTLPSEGWEELIECWSCHNNEFKSMLDLTIKPRPKGILLSHLYIILNDNDMPECCTEGTRVPRKVFMNEINVEGFSNQVFLYKFLLEHFKMNSHFLYTLDNKVYELTCFYKCTVFIFVNGEFCGYKAIKVGVKETEKKMKEKNSINEYFIRLIHTSMMRAEIEILGYDIGFFLEKYTS